MRQTYNDIMDLDRNPLRPLTAAQRLQAMIILSVMWTTIFCLSTSAWFGYGELVVGHLLFILGIAITAMTVHQAKSSTGHRSAVHTCGDNRSSEAR